MNKLLNTIRSLLFYWQGPHVLVQHRSFHEIMAKRSRFERWREISYGNASINVVSQSQLGGSDYCLLELSLRTIPNDIEYVMLAEDLGANIANPAFTIPATEQLRYAALKELCQ